MRGSLISLKKSMIGGTVSGIMITSSLSSIGFLSLLYPFFNALALTGVKIRKNQHTPR
jgi:hypothetical protein